MSYDWAKRFANQLIAHISAPWVSRLIGCTLIMLLLWLVNGSAVAQSPYPQRVDRGINDYAHVLSNADKAAIHGMQEQLLRERGAEVVVVTINSIADYDVPDKTIEAFATNLFNTWGIGDRQRNDGVLLLVAIRDRKVRIEVGTGYGADQNSAMQHVIDDDILPAFRSGAYSAGIARGVGDIQAALVAAPQGWSSLVASPLIIAIAGLLIAALVAVVAVAKTTLRRYRRRGASPMRQVVVCKGCRRPMDELGMELVNADLDVGQRVEQHLRSVTYQLWECQACGTRKRYSSPGATVRYRACPKCRYRTLEEDEQITRAPTTNRRGLKVTTRRCHYCGYTAELKTKLTQKRSATRSALPGASAASSYSSYNSNTSSYDNNSFTSYDSGSSASDTGGSSSGDGASGSW